MEIRGGRDGDAADGAMSKAGARHGSNFPSASVQVMSAWAGAVLSFVGDWPVRCKQNRDDPDWQSASLGE